MRLSGKYDVSMYDSASLPFQTTTRSGHMPSNFEFRYAYAENRKPGRARSAVREHHPYFPAFF